MPKQSSLPIAYATLYRLYDIDDVLLYVGVTSRGRQRLTQHARDKHWWFDVVRADFEHCWSRAEALRREAIALWHEQPRYNVIGATFPLPPDAAPPPPPRRRGEAAAASHCAHGHLLDEVNTYLQKKPGGGTRRQCKTCRRESILNGRRRRALGGSAPP